MNIHEIRGFQRTFLNDIYHVEEQLQAYDKDLYIMWNPNTGEHLIMDGLLEMAIMKLPQIGFEQLDSRIVEHIRKIHTANGFSAVQTIEDTEKKREQEQDRKLNDLAEDFAKESKEAFQNAYYYGRVDGVQKYTHGTSIGGG